MAVIVAGVSHNTAPVGLRERLAYRPHDIDAVLTELRESAGLREVVLLSTCNRTEFYIVEGEQEFLPALLNTLSKRLGEDATPYLYVRRDRDAVSHLFRVASGLDSMILGEAQIHGQVRDAWEMCRQHSGAILNRLFQTSLLVASRVRTETHIARGAASVSSAAVQLSKKIFGSLNGRRAMVLGAGEMAELALECLLSEGVRTAIVANRTFDHAQELAAKHGATAMHYDECWRELHAVDILLCSTAAPRPIVLVQHVQPAIDARGDQPLCILDIALPRDVDAAVAELDNVFLYDLDDLRSVAAASLEKRKWELPAAESIISVECEKYWQWLAGLSAVPVVTELRAEMDRIRAAELANALRKIAPLSEVQADALEGFSRSLMNKMLHEPTVRLRAAAANGRGLGVVDTVRYLFALDKEQVEEHTNEQSKELTKTDK